MDLPKADGRYIEDRTGWTAEREKLNYLTTVMNPLTAVRNVRDKLVERGIIAPKPIIKLGLPRNNSGGQL
jgi:hypothetical protein